MWFEESRLDDERALASVDLRLRTLAESGARVRREAGDAAGALDRAVASLGEVRPRTVIAAGPDSRLLRAVLEPVCPVPFVAWPHRGLPGWAGSMDLLVVLAPDGSDPATAAAVDEAGRRGCQVVLACPTSSLVAEHARGRYTTILPATTDDPLATAVVMLTFLDRAGLGPAADPTSVADALDTVAVACSPHRDVSVNPAKTLALTLADATPLLWGGSVVAARAARRVAESIRRTSGRPAIAGDAEHLLPLVEATAPRDVFDDPVATGVSDLRPVLVVLDDGAEEEWAVAERHRLLEAADHHDVRVELSSSDLVEGVRGEVGRYASLQSYGSYAAEYLRLGLVPD